MRPKKSYVVWEVTVEPSLSEASEVVVSTLRPSVSQEVEVVSRVQAGCPVSVSVQIRSLTDAPPPEARRTNEVTPAEEVSSTSHPSEE
jgi:hypothetical protein